MKTLLAEKHQYLTKMHVQPTENMGIYDKKVKI